MNEVSEKTFGLELEYQRHFLNFKVQRHFGNFDRQEGSYVIVAS